MADTTRRTDNDESRASSTTREGRPVVVSSLLTLDGYTVGPDEDISWAIAGFDRDMQNDIGEHMGHEADHFVFGRLTFEIFAAYWPNAVPYDKGDELEPAAGKEDPRIIRALNECPKSVFSKTLKKSDWANTHIYREGPEEEIRRLKKQPGKAISVQGSASVVHALQRADLVDEYLLYVHPVLLGAGKLLFASGVKRQDLALVRSKPYANGVVSMTFRRKDRGQ